MEKDKFLEEIINLTNSAQTGDIYAMYELNIHLKNTDFFTEEEIFDNIFLNAEKEHNVFSIFDLAQYYREGRYVSESIPKYIQLLMDIAESDVADIVIRYCEEDPNLDFSVKDELDATMLKNVIGASCFELAWYYKNASDIDLLQNAERYASYALSCKYPSYPGEYVTLELIAEIQNAIDQYGIQAIDINEVFCEDQDLSNADDFARRVYRQMIPEIGKDAWNKFTEETRKDLYTATLEYICLKNLSTDMQKNIDFSSVILPLMKTLEYELKIRFHCGYHHYLRQERMDGEKFVRENDIKDTYNREAILKYYKKDKKFELSDPQKANHFFTLGKFRYLIGIGKSEEMKSIGYTADLTAINYCKKYLNIKDKSGSKIDEWLWMLSQNITSILSYRNDSAHGGNIMNINNAENAFKALIYVKKILIDLVTDFPFQKEDIFIE